MALPALTIHTSVKYAGRQFAKASNPAVKRWGPTMVGIGIVPALPYLFDHPVSRLVGQYLRAWSADAAAGRDCSGHGL